MAKEHDRVGQKAVRERTGKTWKQWFAVLDRAAAQELDHKGIVALIGDRYELSPWWCQMITVAYEQEKGLRKVHEKPGGFEIGRSKTIDVPVNSVYKAWRDKRQRKRWLGDDAELEIRKATVDKSLRITWVDGNTHLDVYFYSKGKAKTQLSVQHKKLAGEKQAERMKAYWAKALSALKTHLEKSP